MSKKISELTSAVSITGTEEVPIVQSGETKKATVDLLRPPIATEITSSSTNTEVAGAKAVYDFANTVYREVTSQYTFTKSSTNLILNSWHVYKMGNTPLHMINIDLRSSSDIASGETFVGTTNCLPVYSFYGAGRAVYHPGESDAHAYPTTAIFLADGRIRIHSGGASTSTNFQIWFIKA